ncbi:MAG: metallophosphoesterase [Myxococcota bacterium]|jgi:3',5'-cyclic AMP phosphodiesterase CpdA|nr:metallophosphoesterase [Myxococcota bacterium]
MLIGHISDLHVLDLTDVRPWQFANKRMAGGLNLLLGRARHHREALLEAALVKMGDLGVEHVVLSGDLSNLSFPCEFNHVGDLLRKYGEAERYTIVPGNHDRYTFSSLLGSTFERSLSDFVNQSTAVEETARWELGEWSWPRLRLFEDVALIALDSASHQPPVFSGGRIGRHQRQRLRALLESEQLGERYRVVVLHHPLRPPPHRRFDWGRGLSDRRALLKLCREGGVDLVMHGHNHCFQLARMGGVLVCEAGSVSASEPKHERHRAKFVCYQIEGGRLVRLTSWVHRGASGFVENVQWSPGQPLPEFGDGG